jgi:uncharacterized protein YbjT (DUF2867 family)
VCAAGLPYQIAIIGAGSIGSALAGHLILAGNKVTIAPRRLEPVAVFRGRSDQMLRTYPAPSRVAASSSGTFGGVGEAWNRSRSVSYQLCCCNRRKYSW